ncbi:MAG: sugar ABC transporter substrate-binding protein [Candidatus Nanopelagicales bacterium]
MRRTTQAGAALAGLALLLSACGSGDNATAESPAATDTAATADASPTETAEEVAGAVGGTLTIWADETRTPIIKKLCTSFAEANGVKCTVQQMEAGEIRSNVVRQNQTGDVPDLFIGAHDWLGELVTNGVVTPIDLGGNADKFSEIAKTAVNYEGQNYGVPYAVENVALLTNKKLSPKCPKTIDAAAELGLKLKKDKKVTLPIALQVGESGDAYHWQPLFSASGGYIFGSNGTDPNDLGIGKEGGVNAGIALGKLGDARVLRASVTYDIAADTFAEGKAPFFISGPWATNDALAGVGKGNLMVCPIPTYAETSDFNPGAPSPSVPFVGVQTFFQTTQAKNAAIASTFLSEAVETTDFMDQVFAADPRPPAWLESAAKADEDPLIKGFSSYGTQGIPLPSIPAMGSVWGDMGLAQFQILSGSNPTTAMKNAGTNITNAIAAAGSN